MSSTRLIPRTDTGRGLRQRTGTSGDSSTTPRPGPDTAPGLSISVIEHIPAAQRGALLTDMALRLRPGGLMVLTVDSREEGTISGTGTGDRSSTIASMGRSGTSSARAPLRVSS